MANTNQNITSIYIPTINCVQTLLKNNTEWRERYRNYIAKLCPDTLIRFKEAEKQFSVPAPFYLYMSLSTAVHKCSSSKTTFELRFHGQSVAEINVKTQSLNDVCVYISVKCPKTYLTNAFTAAQMSNELQRLIKYSAMQDLSWRSEEAKDFRKIYAELEKKVNSDSAVKSKLSQPEHDMECALLKNYSQKSSAGKKILNIQPVMMGNTNARFQMPTPIKGCEAKKGIGFIKYSKQYGGGIDILARVGNGRSTKLAVLELKDGYSKNEPAEKAIHQAIAYAAFIRELLRSESGEKWWEFFGFGGNIPQKLEIKAIIVMPYYDNAETNFGGTELPVGNDVIKLGYIYRSNNPAKAKINIF